MSNDYFVLKFLDTSLEYIYVEQIGEKGYNKQLYDVLLTQLRLPNATYNEWDLMLVLATCLSWKTLFRDSGVSRGD